MYVPTSSYVLLRPSSNKHAVSVAGNETLQQFNNQEQNQLRKLLPKNQSFAAAARLDPKRAAEFLNCENDASPEALGWTLLESDAQNVELKRELVKTFSITYQFRDNTALQRLVDVYELLSSPQILEVEGFLTADECDKIIGIADDLGWMPSKTSVGTAYSAQNDYASLKSASRTSYSSHLDSSTNPLIKAVERRLATCLGVSIRHMEACVLLRYYPEQQFKVHHDGDFRPMSAIVYLSDVEEGGETALPNLGVKLCPKRGAAVCWRNLLADGTADMRTLHAGLPVLKGVKYCMPVFINRNIMRPDEVE